MSPVVDTAILVMPGCIVEINKPMETDMLSYAQNMEDVVLARLFEGQAKGFYIDVGGGHFFMSVAGMASLSSRNRILGRSTGRFALGIFWSRHLRVVPREVLSCLKPIRFMVFRLLLHLMQKRQKKPGLQASV
jgi:hypothetical protein